jgi:hypothetical protein
MNFVLVAIWMVLMLAWVAGCESDSSRCDPNQRLYHGLCYATDAGVDGGGGSAAAPVPVPVPVPDAEPDEAAGEATSASS